MIREIGVVLLKRAALSLLAAAVRLDRGKPEPEPDEELPDEELPITGGPLTPEAASLVVEKPMPDSLKSKALEGSIEARLAKARGAW